MLRCQFPLLPILLLVALAPVARAGAATRSVHESRAASPTGIVEIENVAGSVDIIGSDAPQVDVSGTLGEKVERLTLSGSGNHTVIRVELPRFFAGGGNGEAHLRIQVPKGSTVKARMVSATYRVAGVDGAQDIQSVSGAIAGTASGDLDVVTASGDIELKRERAGVSHLKSVSGGLHLSGALGATLAESVSGVVRLEPAALPDADVALRSLSGALSSCNGPQATHPSFGPGSRLEYRSGRGGTSIAATTTSGAIRLCAGQD